MVTYNSAHMIGTGNHGSMVGAVVSHPAEIGGYIKADGAYVLIEDYPVLFSVIGHTFGPLTLDEPLRFRWLRRLLRLPTHKTIPNPNAPKEGYFRLPDLRGQFLKETT